MTSALSENSEYVSIDESDRRCPTSHAEGRSDVAHAAMSPKTKAAEVRLLRGRFKSFLLSYLKGKRKVRAPIFVKLSLLSAVLILVVISIISYTMLETQKAQLYDQMINLGRTMATIVAKNAPDKLLADEDLALFRLLDDIAQNDAVLEVLITDENGVARAHSHIREVNKRFFPPADLTLIRKVGGLKVSSLREGEKEILFFEAPLTYQNIKVGDVYLKLSQERIHQSMHLARVSVIWMTVFMTTVGVLLSSALSIYFSIPIRKLQEGTKALGLGDLSHRVDLHRRDELGDLASAFNKMAEDLSLKEKIKDSFGRYVTPEIVNMVLADPDSRWMKASRVEATVVFVDIRGFTTLAEDRDPELIINILNDYFSRITDIISKHGGHLDKFVGDAVMAVFGAPLPIQSHAEAAVDASVEIQKELAGLNQKERGKGIAISVGVGINSGEMVAGNLGSEKRMEYTFIGDNVNVASRLTLMAQPGEILLTRRTRDLIDSETSLRLKEKGRVYVKGRKRRVTVYSISGESAYNSA
jgi:adenylate cyclase